MREIEGEKLTFNIDFPAGNLTFITFYAMLLSTVITFSIFKNRFRLTFENWLWFRLVHNEDINFKVRFSNLNKAWDANLLNQKN